MSNLNTLRKMASAAESAGLEVILKPEEARSIIREAEQLHGGNRELTGDCNTKITELQLKITRLEKKNQELRAKQPVDKVADLLPE